MECIFLHVNLIDKHKGIYIMQNTLLLIGGKWRIRRKKINNEGEGKT